MCIPTGSSFLERVYCWTIGRRHLLVLVIIVLIVRLVRYTLGLIKDNAGGIGDSLFVDGDDKSLQQTIWSSVQQCDPWLQPRLWNNVVLHGGTAGLQGLSTRLNEELSLLGQSQFGPPSILCAPDPCLAAWRGATNLTQTDISPKFFVDSHAWNEYGPNLARSYFLG